MSDPRRLLDEPSELSDSERRLMTAGREAAPPSELHGAVWGSLLTKVSALQSTQASPRAEGAAAGTAQAVPVGSLVFKAVLAVIVLGALALAGRALLRTNTPAVPAPGAVPSASARAARDESVPTATAAPLPPLAVSALSEAHARAPAPLHSSHDATAHATLAPSPSAHEVTSEATEESRMVTAARDALRAGDSARALSLLARAQQRFGSGVLGQEREALTVEGLAKSGQQAAAQTRGRAFLKSYANSPYAARIRTLIGAN